MRLLKSSKITGLFLAGLAILFWQEPGFPLASLTSDYPEYLEPCTRLDLVYTGLFVNNKPFEQWSENYHQAVSDVFDEYVDGLEVGKAECGSESTAGFIPPGEKLREMAKKLPPWQNEEKLKQLTRNDLAAVTQEFLRVYNCALVEGKYLLPRDIVDEYSEEKDGVKLLNLVKFLGKSAARERLIAEETELARLTLERMYNVIGMMEGMDNLEGELVCLQRSSLDIRNIMALAAESSSCLARTFNARDVLHDIPE